MLPRKQTIEGGTKNKILEVGSRIFFEKGFDATGIRTIMQEVGTDVSVFYYYYKSKDALFDEVINNFFEPYQIDFERLVKDARQNPFQPLLKFFIYIKKSTREFREKYADNMHSTVRLAIREQTLTIIEPYIEEIINILIDFGAKPKMSAHLTAIFLAHGVGSVILHEDADWVDSVSDDLRKTVNMILGLDEEISRKMFEQGNFDMREFPEVPLWNT